MRDEREKLRKIDQLELEELTQLNELLLVIKKHKNPARLR